MNVHHSLICFFLLSLINAEIHVHKGTEGGNITVRCTFKLSGNGRKFFRKEECKEEDILIETTDVRTQRGRYSIKYEEGFFPVRSTILYVSITQLTKSDSGRYRCGLGRTLLPDGFWEIEITVTDALSTSEPDRTSVPSASTPPGSFTPSSSSPETTEQSDQQLTDRPTAAAAHSGVLLYMGVVLTIIVVLLSLALLIFCWRRTDNPKDPSADTGYTSVTEANRVNEDIRADRRSRSPPEVSSVNVYANFTKPNETTDECRLATAASSQHKAEDDLSKLIYSQVDFSNGTTSVLHSATSGHANDVIYSMPRVDSSAPLYSVISKQ